MRYRIKITGNFMRGDVYKRQVDVEIFTGDEIVKKIIDGVHAAGARVIASNHDFRCV